MIAGREACTSDRARAGPDATGNDSQGIFTVEDIGVDGFARTTNGNAGRNGRNFNDLAPKEE